MSFAAPMAHFYDLLNDGADYAAERDLIVSLLQDGAERGLDLGCGTGSLCLLLSGLYEMTGVDLSEEMLAAADEKAFSARAKIRFVCQDITHLSLGNRFDFCLCLHDTINYLSDNAALSRLFERVKAHLSEGGVFIFDFNQKRRFTEDYGTSTEVLERDGLFCVWEREFHPASGNCDFLFHFFARRKDGLYEKSEEYERQHYFAPRTVERLCRSSGLEPTLLCETPEHFIYKATHERG